MNDWRDLNHDGKVDGLDYLIYEDITKNTSSVNKNTSSGYGNKRNNRT